MAERSDVVERADALMRRRSSFVAAQASRAGNANDDDNDVPVLTEIVPAEPAAGLAAGAPVEALDAVAATAAADAEAAVTTMEVPELFADTVMPPLEVARAAALRSAAELEEKRVAQLSCEIGAAIAQRMEFELPTLIEAALVKAGDELRAGITSTIGDAVREVIAQHRRPPQDAEHK